MTPTIQDLLERKPAIEAAAKLFGASDIRIFGSVARGTAQDGSDVDVLIRMDRGRSLLDLIGFEQALADALGLRVDVVTENSLHPMLRSTILTEALAL
jgi:predicted nucleotidyltransferase